ncbi:hypothetical protein HMPREF0682_1687 [Propionibacterium acidifaciens F0233]|uniref:Uncharacterized protein n=1 Tax=Propionibacterium acidifaciens F0233 TaxID=553198 RepID=U2RYK5_9ACTN|nr:hypothetical protein HMPREF0682_1687 [Propionibacterium acidifaciens F0233]
MILPAQGTLTGQHQGAGGHTPPTLNPGTDKAPQAERHPDAHAAATGGKSGTTPRRGSWSSSPPTHGALVPPAIAPVRPRSGRLGASMAVRPSRWPARRRPRSEHIHGPNVRVWIASRRMSPSPLAEARRTIASGVISQMGPSPLA